ncbi:hypothetical protein KC354_g6755 [Hortaea werneckii]|nr:hypothetical protein KC354_g6755 [Hortaea werneckii]
MESSKKASSSGGTPNQGKGQGSQQQVPSIQPSAGRPKSQQTVPKEDTKSPRRGSSSTSPNQSIPNPPLHPPKPRATTRTQSPTPRTIFTPANNNFPFTGTFTSAVSTPESQKAQIGDDDSPVNKRSGDPEAFQEISAWEARGMPGSRKTSAELDREYSHLHQPTVPGPLDEAEFDSDEED